MKGVSRARSLGNVSATRAVPSHIARPDYSSIAPMQSSWVTPLSGSELDKMREACRVSRAALEYIVDVVDREVEIADDGTSRAVRKGQLFTTDSLDELLHTFIVEELRCYPSPLGYHPAGLLDQGFPKSVCTSVNSVFCHGIPDDNALYEGDSMNIDISVFKEGYHGDNSAMATIGAVSEATRDVIDHTQNAMNAAISICRPGVSFSRIGDVIARYLAENAPHLQVVPEFTGHGIGRTFHLRPWILHVPNSYETGVMEEGQVFTIEPVITNGSVEHFCASDGWTIYAKQEDALSAQWEHSIVITKDNHEILSKT